MWRQGRAVHVAEMPGAKAQVPAVALFALIVLVPSSTREPRFLFPVSFCLEHKTGKATLHGYYYYVLSLLLPLLGSFL